MDLKNMTTEELQKLVDNIEEEFKNRDYKEAVKWVDNFNELLDKCPFDICYPDLEDHSWITVDEVFYDADEMVIKIR